MSQRFEASDPQKESFYYDVYAVWIILKVGTNPFFPPSILAEMHLQICVCYILK